MNVFGGVAVAILLANLGHRRHPLVMLLVVNLFPSGKSENESKEEDFSPFFSVTSLFCTEFRATQHKAQRPPPCSPAARQQ
jgi:hypothetical protein